MANITIIGGTGYAGTAIVKQAAAHGHHVTSLSRSLPSETHDTVHYLQGSALDTDNLAEATNGAEVVVAALSPRGDMAGKVGDAYQQLANLAAEHGSRLIIIGGFSALRPAAGAPRFTDSGDVPAEYAAEAHEMAGVLQDLQTKSPADLDWLFVSPAAEFNAFNPGEATGAYRVGGEVALFDKDGKSAISGADFALGVVDEIEKPAHHREQISLAY